MKDRTAVVLKIFLTVLLVISAVLFIVFYTQGESFTGTVLTWSYILLIFTLAVTLIFPIVFFILNPRKGLIALASILGIAVLYFISYYGFASGSIEGDVYEKFNITEGISHAIGSVLYLTYVLGGIAILAIVYSGISSFFK